MNNYDEGLMLMLVRVLNVSIIERKTRPVSPDFSVAYVAYVAYVTYVSGLALFSFNRLIGPVSVTVFFSDKGLRLKAYA